MVRDRPCRMSSSIAPSARIDPSPLRDPPLGPCAMPDPADVAWQRARTMAEKLVLALDELDDAGGLRRLAGTWKPSAREKARATLAEARKSLEAALAQMKAPQGK